MTAQELAIKAKQAKPHVRYAYSTDDTTVAAFTDHWTPVAGRILTGGFASIPVELLINGVRMSDSLTFIEV